MSQILNIVLAFDGTNYGYWKARLHFFLKSIEKSKDLEEMKIEELVGSLQTYEISLPPVKKVKTINLKASNK
jgi:hypothetical protein